MTGQTQTLQESRGNVGLAQIMGFMMLNLARRTGSGPETDRKWILVDENIIMEN